MRPANGVHFTLNEAIERSRRERLSPLNRMSLAMLEAAAAIGGQLAPVLREATKEITELVKAYEATKGDTLMNRIPEQLRTRTFWTSIITAIVLVLTAMDVITLETEQLIATIVALVAVVFGNAWVEGIQRQEETKLFKVALDGMSERDRYNMAKTLIED